MDCLCGSHATLVRKEETMKAIVKIDKDLDQFKLVDLEIPEISESEILVKMKAIGVGVHDAYYFDPKAQYPYIIGIEGAGEIVKLGKNVEKYKINDRIAFVSLNQTKGGTWAEYAVITMDSLIIPIPNQMSFELAASLPIAGGTALRALEAMHMEAGQSLFIAGASGAIGSLIIQLASQAGLLVSGSASSKNQEYMKRLGAIHTVDYSSLNWIQEVKDWSYDGVDGVISIPKNSSMDCLELLKPGGKILSVSNDQITSDEVDHVPYPFNSKIRKSLLTLFKQVDEGDVFVFVDETYPLEDAIEALRIRQKGHARGKTIILLD